MIKDGFLKVLLASALILGLGLLGLILIVDPYRVSPIAPDIRHVNHFKPRSDNIDRQAKPLNVLWKQPRTVFMGTSRVHWGLNPADLDGTRFAPAYNAAAPATWLGENVADLGLYARLDPNLKAVFVELRFSQFLAPWTDRHPRTIADLVKGSQSLFVSLRALLDSARTLAYNLRVDTPCAEVRPEGWFHQASGQDPVPNFRGFPQGMWDAWNRSGRKLPYAPSALEAVHAIIDFARAHDLELVFLLLPEHVYFDYFIDTLDLWPMMETWLPEISGAAAVVSFTRLNAITREEGDAVRGHWSDPNHFTPEVGRMVLKALAGTPLPETPPDFMEHLTPESARRLIALRRTAIRRWRADHPAFDAAVKAEFEKHGATFP